MLQSGHSDSVMALAFTPDGNYLVSGSYDSSVRLWDLRVGREVRVLGHHTREVRSLAMCPDGRCVVSGGNDAALQLWELPGGRLLRSFKGHTQSIKSMAVTSDGRYLVTGAGDPPDFEDRRPDYTARIWDLRSGKAVRRFAGHDAQVWSVALDERSGRLATGSSDEKLRLWDLQSGKLLRTIDGFSSYVQTKFTPDGRFLLTACSRALEMWDAATGERIAVLAERPRPYFMAISPSGTLAAYPSDAGIGLIDLQTRREISRLAPPPAAGRLGNAQSLAFTPDGRRLAAGFGDGRIVLWQVATQRLERELRGHTAPIRTAAVAGPWIATSADEAGPIQIWDSRSGRLVRTLAHENRIAFALAFDPTGRWLAVSGGNYNEETLERPIDVWDVATGSRLAQFSHRGLRVEYLTWSPDGRCLGATGDGEAKVFDLRTGALQATIRPATKIVEFGRDCGWLAAGSRLNDLTYWDIPSGRVRERREGVGWAYLLTGDREWLASVGRREEFRLVNLRSNQRITFRGHRDYVSDITFSNDNRSVASASWDGDVRLWSLPSGRLLRILPSRSRAVSVAFTQDDREIVASYHDGTTRIWDAATGAELLVLVAFRGSGDWLAVAPDGLFDGTADAMQQVAWRITGTNNTVPLESFFSDFYRPGLLADVLAGERPKAPVDVVTVARVPGLRRMLADELAHLEVRGNKALICFHDVPGVAVGIAAGETDIPTVQREFRVVPDDATCRYQMELPVQGSPGAVVAHLQPSSAPPTRWEGKATPTSGATLHVLCIGVSDYRPATGLDPLPYAVPSARSVEAFFARQAAQPRGAYKQVKVWPGLYDRAATRDAIRRHLSDLGATMRPGDVLFLYLVGHGLVPPGQEMFSLVPYDGRDADIAGTGISTAMLAEQLRDAAVQRFAIVIDTCQAGAAVDALGRIGEEKARRAERSGLGGGGHVVAAALPLAYAVQLRSGASALAATLLEGLVLHPGQVRISEVLEHIRTRLPAVSSQTMGFRQVPLTQSAGADFDIAVN